ncbi:oligosaccharide flippase family protein [Halobacterium salinarum]|uniref:oligosaccharide flippase family protein n=1 Tax=Halobacterium salinarum TaxID=2242 RepID=UPI0025539F95|nr:oligosaccharide flippase family protein [Halobacterium salinarum]MDL0141328.1 oligosaccharide flippase family protein [Halobacterium salinarum]
MRYGRTSIIHFLSKLVMSFSGFIATVVLTRTLGQEQYGTYVVVLSVLSWVVIGGKLGLPQAVRKRVSEADGGNYVVSGALAQVGLYAVVATCIWITRPYLSDFMGLSVTWVLVLMLAVRLALGFVRTVLEGQHLVHVSSVLSPVEWTSRSAVQVALVLSGSGIAGAFAGYIVGAIVAVIIGAYFVSIPEKLPSRREFSRLKSYAQFSWLGSIKGRTFLSMDTIVLAVFVSNSFIAVYEVAWNLASLFAIFGISISRTLFPEMSEISSNEGTEDEIAGLLRVSLAYSGLFIIPGLVGAALLGDLVLTIYGPGFDTGYYVLIVLTFARLLYGYMGQFLSTINALDYPGRTFNINAVFVVVNLTLNLTLTWQFGWYGAAAATTTSAGMGLILGYYYAKQVVDVTIPLIEVGKQCLSAVIMAAIVSVGRLNTAESLPVAVVLVGIGACAYFASLLALSQEFRTTVEDNLPFQFPTIGPR